MVARMSSVLTLENFQRIKRMILARGDRRTYCNMYNSNPHIEADGFHAYLSPDVGQENINCDPARSDFDQLTIYDQRAGPDHRYCSTRIESDTLTVDRGSARAMERYFAALLVLVA